MQRNEKKLTRMFYSFIEVQRRKGQVSHPPRYFLSHLHRTNPFSVLIVFFVVSFINSLLLQQIVQYSLYCNHFTSKPKEMKEYANVLLNPAPKTFRLLCEFGIKLNDIIQCTAFVYSLQRNRSLLRFCSYGCSLSTHTANKTFGTDWCKIHIRLEKRVCVYIYGVELLVTKYLPEKMIELDL